MKDLQLKNGDIILCDYTKRGCMSIFTSFKKKFTKSNYSHSAIVFKDPSFILSFLKGLYVRESNLDWKTRPTRY